MAGSQLEPDLSVLVPSTWINKDVAGSAILEDPRLEQLFFSAALLWAKDNTAVAHRRAPKTREPFAEWEVREACKLHARRSVKALRSAKSMPEKTTSVQYSKLLRDEDLPELNRIFRETLNQHIVLTAQALNDCAVMFSDPAKIAKMLDF